MTNFCQACGGAISLHFSTLPGCRCVNPPPINYVIPRHRSQAKEEHMKEEWLMPGAVVPVDAETTAALVTEIKRLISVVGGMALNQRYPWVGLTDEEVQMFIDARWSDGVNFTHFIRAIEAKLREKNT